MLGYIVNSEEPISEETVVYLKREKAEEVLENFKKAYPEQAFYLANIYVE